MPDLLSFVFTLYYKRGERKGDVKGFNKRGEKRIDHPFQKEELKLAVNCSHSIYGKSTTQTPFSGFCFTVIGTIFPFSEKESL